MTVLEPPRLLSSESLGSRVNPVLAVAWEDPFTRQMDAIGLLSRNLDGHYSFQYIKNVLMTNGFRPLVGFPDLYQRYQSKDLFPLFAQRVMSSRRRDYPRFIASLGLANTPSPWEQLSHSGGRRAGDNLQLLAVPTPAEGNSQTWELEFLAHEMRHVPDKIRNLGNREVVVSREAHEGALSHLRPGDELELIPEHGNPINNKAMMVATTSGIPLGFVPDVFTGGLSELPNPSVRCFAKVINNSSAPWSHRLIAKLVCKVPSNFEFFASPSWQILADNQEP